MFPSSTPAVSSIPVLRHHLPPYSPPHIVLENSLAVVVVAAAEDKQPAESTWATAGLQPPLSARQRLPPPWPRVLPPYEPRTSVRAVPATAAVQSAASGASGKSTAVGF